MKFSSVYVFIVILPCMFNFETIAVNLIHRRTFHNKLFLIRFEKGKIDVWIFSISSLIREILFKFGINV